MPRKHTTIMFLINSLSAGGAEKMFTEEINALSAAGYRVCLALLYGNKTDQLAHSLSDAVDVIPLNFRNLFDVGGYGRLIRHVKMRGVTCVYATLDDANVAARVLKMLKPTLKVHIREANIVSTKSFKMRVADVFLNILPNSIVAISNGVKRSIPFYQSKVVVVENAISVPSEVALLRQRENIEILSVGSLTHKKDHLFLLRALRGARCSYHLSIAGEGVVRSDLEDYIQRNGMDRHVTLLGALSRETLNKRYLSSDMFVLSSRWEGFPNVLLEAMAYGLPVVSTAVSGAEDLIEDGVSGFLVPIGDEEKLVEAIQKLALDADLRKRIGMQARERTKHFSFDVHIKKLVTVLGL